MGVAMLTVAVPARDAIVIATVRATSISLTQAVRNRRHINVPVARRLTLASLVGAPIGLLAFATVGETTRTAAVGVAVLVATAANAWPPAKHTPGAAANIAAVTLFAVTGNVTADVAVACLLAALDALGVPPRAEGEDRAVHAARIFSHR